MEEQSLGVHATALQKAQFQERKNTFYRKVLSWQDIQALYVPAIMALRATGSDRDLFDVPGEISVDKVQLLLPSDIGGQIPWNKKLGEVEWLLREAQAHDSLNKLRENLRLRDFLLKKKKDWSRGVRENTRSQTAIGQATDKVTACVTKYRTARTALSVLAPLLGKGDKWSSQFSDLQDDDIKGLPADGLGEGSRKLSWIWTCQGVVSSPEIDDEPQLIDGL